MKLPRCVSADRLIRALERLEYVANGMNAGPALNTSGKSVKLSLWHTNTGVKLAIWTTAENKGR